MPDRLMRFYDYDARDPETGEPQSGYGVEVTDPLTGKVFRNGVRLRGPRDEAQRELAESLLRAWLDDALGEGIAC